jgi:phage/plasmid-like protein (TIGR03299 family)
MAHEFESGFFVAQAAWHGLGTVLQDAPTTAEAISQAGLDWRVLEEPFYQVEDEEAAVLRKKLVRDRDQRLLGVVNPDYTPLQNQDAFRWFDPLLATGQVALEAAGSLQAGKRIWVLARILNADAEVSLMDWVRPYLLLHNSHDGSTAVWLQFTPVRVVCMNTLAGAAAHRFGDLWQKKAVCIPHSLTLTEQLTKIRNLLDLTRREFQVCVEEYKAMANQEINQELLSGYLSGVFRLRAPLFDPVGQQVAHNFEQGIGNQGRTLWDAYNAVTEWIDHQSDASADSRLGYSWFGRGGELRDRAHKLALKMVQTRQWETESYWGDPLKSHPLTLTSGLTSRR